MITAGPTPTTAGSHDNAEHIHAVLEEPRSRRQQQPIPTSGPELANMMKIGTRVMRGVDWKWGDQVRNYTHIDIFIQKTSVVRLWLHVPSISSFSYHLKMGSMQSYGAVYT